MDEWTVEALAGSSWAGGEKYYLKDKHDTGRLVLWTAWPCDCTGDTVGALKQEADTWKGDRIEGVTRVDDVIVTGTVVYTVTETSLTDTCLDDAKHNPQSFTPAFLWSLLRQLTAIAKRLSTAKTVLFGKKITADTIYFDDRGSVTVTPFYPLDCKHDPRKCDNLMCDIGDIFKEILANDDNDSKTYQDMRSVTKLIQGHGKACTRKPESILYHPTVLSHFKDGNVTVFEEPVKTSNDSAFESDDSNVDLALSLNKSTSLDDLSKTSDREVFKISGNMMESKPLKRKGTPKKVLCSPTVLALDLDLPGYVPKKGNNQMKVWQSRLELAKEPEEVTEEALNRVWLERLTALQEREEALRQKELEMNKKKILDEISQPKRKPKILNPPNVDMSGATLQTAMTHKFVPGVVTRSKKRTISSSDTSTASQCSGRDIKITHRRSSSVKTRSRKKKVMSYVDMDSSLSADQGDTSVLPTSSKLTSDKVPRPTSIHNVSRRKVHFNSKNNPFAEYDSISSTTLTFFEIENLDQRYEIPRSVPAEAGNLAERIAKFTYLDLEEMTNKKRSILEDMHKSPPTIDRNTKPSLQSKVKTANMIKKFGGDLKNIQVTNTTVTDKKPENRRKTICNLLTGKENNQPKKTKDNFATPAPVKSKDKRKSILGFKTPFKFYL